MINANVMYVRPGSLFREYQIMESCETLSATGRPVAGYSGNVSKTLRGCLAQATDEDKGRHSVTDHIVTHTIVQSGSPKAKRKDKLILGSRVFYIVDIDDTGGLGISTLYYAEERIDIR